MTKFTDLGLDKPILKAIQAEGYDTPTPIQAKAIPHLIAGKDVLGIAQTGTGKTAAFALPILQKLAQINGKPMKFNPVKACSKCHMENFAEQGGLGYPIEEARIGYKE